MARTRHSQQSVEAVLDALRRAQARPRAAVEHAVNQLLQGAVRPAGTSERAHTYRIDDLARITGTTTRNVRAYQERGLLHPPRRVGRVALFDDSHVSRLKMITSMLDRGYTSAHIHELLEAWERGGDLSDVLGLEKLVRPWAADQPTTMTLREVRELAGDRASLDRLVADGLVELRSKDAVVRRPMLLQAFAEMRRYGMSMTVAIEVHERVTPLLDEVSRILVEAGATQVAELVPAPEQLSDRAVADLVAMLLRIRTVAMDSATATLAHAIEQRIEDMLGAYLASLAGDPPATRGAG